MTGAVPPAALAVGGIYCDEDGTEWAVVGRSAAGSVMLTSPPSDAPDWSGVLLETDGAWYVDDRFTGHVEGLTPTGRRASCRECRGDLVASPGTDPANHRPGCPWLAAAVRAVRRGIASPTGRWLRVPRPEDRASG